MIDENRDSRVTDVLGSHSLYAAGDEGAVASAIEDLLGFARDHGMHISPLLRDEALTQIQHISYDGEVQMDFHFRGKGDERTDFEAMVEAKMQRITNIAEACEPDEDWTPLKENSDGDVIGGGDAKIEY